ncbi:hypothetical protein [Neobacillus mesonae]|uniref:hypothetical protein n=1 Tax=Neobacillus mesonae TaxID=1193713 RepID=UPI0025735C85|nr:hypothetical protein [Neobacillus mesonae]
MKFLCFGYLSPEKMIVFPKGEIEAFMSECSPTFRNFMSGQVMMDVGVETEVISLQRENGNLATILVAFMFLD